MAIFSILSESMGDELQRLSALVEGLKNCEGDRERIALLDRDPRVVKWLSNPSSSLVPLNQPRELIIKSLVAIDQEVHLLEPASSEKLKMVLEELLPVETFYKEMGGIVGYHWMLLSFLSQEKKDRSNPLEICGKYYPPPGIDISVENETIQKYILEGIVSLPLLGEIYPVGGAADRLKLFDLQSGQPLPAAKLTFCEHSLLEGLLRDVQAREYLYFKLFKEQITTPVAMMTSFEKDNHRHILSLCEEKEWFGRPKESFRFFCQPVVPTMDKEGRWCLNGSMRLLMKPGGHGVLWKIAKEEGIFDWLESLGRKKILIRQINNPVAGTDHGLLAFCGIGFQGNKIFGFASCSRQVESAEGMNVLIEKISPVHKTYCLTNIEYCDFSKFSIEDIPIESGSLYSQFPSNTNILFADIAAVKETVKLCPVPGMLINLKKMSYTDGEGNVQNLEVARLESTMQNIADCFAKVVDSSVSLKDVELSTYLTYNHRRKTISTTKKLYQNDGSLLETPEGCFYDLLQNAHDLLTNRCQVSLPEMPDVETYLQHAPPFLFQFHPALGPLYSVIAQKIRGGNIGLHSELKLEIAEVEMTHLNLVGSLHIIADQIMGELDPDGILHYSERVGRCRLLNVTVENRGFDRSAPNIYWKGEIDRFELCEIVIHGDGEFYAENVILRGALRIEVEGGTRLTAIEEKGELIFKKESLCHPSHAWSYHLGSDSSIKLKEMQQA
ncbi:MAG: UTP--glucose-1-phosphate uridylyltransferase [Rhabdochlamydiaceae bacterium]